MVSVNKSVGKKIKKLRKIKGLTQEKLSWEAGLNRGYVGFIERGERNPSIGTLTKIAKVLKVTMDELFRR